MDTMSAEEIRWEWFSQASPWPIPIGDCRVWYNRVMTEKERMTQREAEVARERAEKVVIRTEKAELGVETTIAHDSTGEIDGQHHTNEPG